MARSTALVTAAAAAALLVVVVGVDAAVNREFFVDVESGGGWLTVVSSPPFRQEERVVFEGVRVNLSQPVEFRLRVDNGYPWAYSEAFRVRDAGVIVNEGRLEAPAGGEGSATFSVPPQRFTGGQDCPETPAGRCGFVSLGLDVGGTELYVSFPVREASS